MENTAPSEARKEAELRIAQDCRDFKFISSAKLAALTEKYGSMLLRPVGVVWMGRNIKPKKEAGREINLEHQLWFWRGVRSWPRAGGSRVSCLEQKRVPKNQNIPVQKRANATRVPKRGASPRNFHPCGLWAYGLSGVTKCPAVDSNHSFQPSFFPKAIPEVF